MNVCLVSQQYPPETARGGIGSQTWNKAHALADAGHTVDVLSCAPMDGPEIQSRTDGRLTVHRMRPPGREFPVYSDAGFWLGYTWSVLRHLTALMETRRFDLIDFPDYAAEGFAFQLERTLNNWAPVVVQLHGPLAIFTERVGWPDRTSDLHRVGAFMEGVSIRSADALMACSANIADFTAGYYGLELADIDVVHCGVDAETFSASETDARTGHRFTILFVGNIAPNKGLGVVCEAFLRLRASNASVRLQILGKGGTDLIDAYREKARAIGAEADFEYVGFVENRSMLPQFYRDASVFCSPAQDEPGVANVYIEAMSCRRPVIAATRGGAPEAVVNGETGLLVPPNDVEALVDALNRLIESPDMRRRMGDAGRDRVDRYFRMERYLERVLATYDRAMARSREKLDQLRGA